MATTANITPTQIAWLLTKPLKLKIPAICRINEFAIADRAKESQKLCLPPAW
jgi:hypothetical protein